MPTLNWIGKEAVVKHHKDVPFRLLEPVPELSCGPADAGNLIVQGDNLHALKSLLPRYAGKVKCIYIDPPYNTGNEGWVYNDNVNSPEIRKWLGEVVGKEGETLDRHDRWLCMMYPRLVLLRQFLSDDGVILISLDDVEAGHLRLLLDEIFGFKNRIATITWNTRNTDNRIKTRLSPDHEYIFVYGKSASSKIEGRVIDRSDFKNPDKDPRGPYVTDPLKGKATASERPNLHDYNMEQPGTANVWKPDPAKGWITDRAGYERLLSENRIWWPPNSATGWPRKKRFLSETQERMPASSFWAEFKTQSGARELDEILDERVFAFPKPLALIQRVISYCAPPDSLVLDSFAGTGTTAHAVLKQNAEDGGNRRFILVEMDEGIARNVTRERVRRVAEGYTNAKGQAVEGLGGGFQFCRLSAEPLFDADGQIRSDVSFAQLAEFVWFAETGTGFTGTADSPLLGIHEGRAIYLLYNGILKDKSVDGGNVLTGPVFEVLPKFAGPKVIYAAANRMGTRAVREGITFKQTPYALEI
ncbi:site-specific DNA-methyltransferase [Gulbenkiania mobilis]|uniref:site-specific DNA-methyltransferase (adenine-specific) n=1 Tax=Gulbenkiania mobilis TaxID=397457 RepID=A0ABY2CVM4_GULMO|nr:site-specific DNA-methyltransferase (adenine-specific)/adenine-specific DNA-methyltransferase [Gulbenkiania mobilis]